MRVAKFDLVIVGGGLAGGLAALALARLRPGLDVAVVDSGTSFGGNHLWSFFASDVAPEDRWLVAPLVCHGWSGNEVWFPAYRRQMKQIYYSIESERLDEALRSTLPARALHSNMKALACSPRSVVLESGLRLEAEAVIDARGGGDLSAFDCGWQKFVGEEWELAEPHDLVRPVIMNAHVTQHDGYRFIYLLPFSPTRLFIEDTYYSADPKLDAETLSARIADYADRHGWQRARRLRREQGVLPVPKDGDIDLFWIKGAERVPKIGVRGGFFHPTTSYSLPTAVRIACLIARADDLSAESLNSMLRDAARRHWADSRYFRMLNRLLFEAAEPDERYRMLQHFYRLPERLIGRFYAGDSTWFDKSRILAGKPPVPVGRAIKVLSRTESERR